jgi:hypothetical protein
VRRVAQPSCGKDHEKVEDVEMAADLWKTRACGLLAALEIASIDDLARLLGLPMDDVTEAARLFRDGALEHNHESTPEEPDVADEVDNSAL